MFLRRALGHVQTRSLAVHARPISPHVTIYKLPLAAVSSITNRVTGVVLSGVVAGAGLISISGGGVIDIVHGIQESAPITIPLLKLSLGFPLVYHYLGGLRHLYWDATAKGISKAAGHTSSAMLIASSGVLSLMLAAYTIPKKDKKAAK